MTRLQAATRRLADSLDSLEKSVWARLAEARQGPETPPELKRLREERERLLSRIGELEGETKELAGLTEEIEGRLDGAIAELREVLLRN